MMHKDVNITDDRASLSCRDPIIRTSTVDGLCMKAEHCANLAGSECKTVAGTEYMTCQCIPGLSPGTEEGGTRCSSKRTISVPLGFLFNILPAEYPPEFSPSCPSLPSEEL